MGRPHPHHLGKEIMVFVERLENQVELLIQIPFTAKFGGATGNFNAHYVAFPTRDWTKLGNEFVEKKLGLQRQQFTTQIEHYDMLAAQFDCMKRINTILIDFCRDLWTYISMDYFKQKIKEGEIGSSAMPHKVNPIDFENAEGNLGMANTLFEYLSAKLPPAARPTDSTTLTASVFLSHSATPIVERGLAKWFLNTDKLKWTSRITETLARSHTNHFEGRLSKPHEALKALTGAKWSTRESMHEFITGWKLQQIVKKN
jgi:adenylosuccinate lyase